MFNITRPHRRSTSAMRHGILQGLQQHRCRIKAIGLRQRSCRVRSRPPCFTSSRIQLRPVAAAAAAEAPEAAATTARPRGRPAHKQAPEEDVGEQGMPELPMVGRCLCTRFCRLLLLLLLQCTACVNFAVSAQVGQATRNCQLHAEVNCFLLALERMPVDGCSCPWHLRFELCNPHVALKWA